MGYFFGKCIQVNVVKLKLLETASKRAFDVGDVVVHFGSHKQFLTIHTTLFDGET